MFSISDNKGFQISFNNGYTVSVQFGGGNYCSNRDLPMKDYGKAVPDSDTAETALMTKDGFVEYQGDDVQGHMTPKCVLELLNYAEALPNYDELAAFVAGQSPAVIEKKEGSFYGYREKTDNYVNGLDD
jgi:hypothetical protein|tara:strand:+ start:332 stop:718 length:387 start_codon:yes stop_codon:yes gene_type:complete